MELGALSLDIGLIVGIAVVCLSGFLIRRGRKLVDREPTFRRLRTVLLIVGALVGFCLSWVPWPTEHELPSQPGVTVRMWGLPVPSGMAMKRDGRNYLSTALGCFAWPLNMVFGAGASQLILYAIARRKRSRNQ